MACLGLMFRNGMTLFLNQESLMSSKTSALSRRTLFSGAATVGAVAAATAVLPGVVKQGAPVVTALPKPTRGGGYTLSEHVQQYYKTTRV